MDTTKLFNNPNFSDLQLEFSSGATLYVHRMILCNSNMYFQKLCGPESRFAESKQACIELKNDDPAAVETVISFIYRVPLTSEHFLKKDWRFWLEVRTAADKYLEPILKDAAEEKFKEVALKGCGTEKVVDILQLIKADMKDDKVLVAFADRLRKTKLADLLANKRFREDLEQGGIKALWAQIDELRPYYQTAPRNFRR